ncbi:DUF2239 family protein [Brevundimonas sp. Root1279]|uniref:DUF2239 family protein n=1 Tax=Brevundimonas sp. Root1279 TaxID=1736443 RepID=UPI0006FE85B6|nr:DUF2239 family protein [Brevundimonas sp. Root1279]KQW84007.1 hypothetical protein ASC65_05130 [Brevundimonas sp. Root1279]
MSVAADHPVFAFEDDRLLARGPAAEVVAAVKAAAEAGRDALSFDAATGKVIDWDLRGTVGEVVARLAAPPEPEKRGPGRPKLGVTAREVTLLPRHWDWLASQPGGASVALRKLVEAALKEAGGPDRARKAKDATYRFMTAVAGDLAGYEEAVRMLFAGDWTAFDAAVEGWPADLRETVRGMAEGAWRNGASRPQTS